MPSNTGTFTFDRPVTIDDATLAQKPYSELPPAGTYANTKLTIPLVSESDPDADDTLEIPITFVVEE